MEELLAAAAREGSRMRRSLDHRCRRSPLFHVWIESDFRKIALTPSPAFSPAFSPLDRFAFQRGDARFDRRVRGEEGEKLGGGVDAEGLDGVGQAAAFFAAPAGGGGGHRLRGAQEGGGAGGRGRLA